MAIGAIPPLDLALSRNWSNWRRILRNGECRTGVGLFRDTDIYRAEPGAVPPPNQGLALWSDRCHGRDSSELAGSWEHQRCTFCAHPVHGVNIVGGNPLTPCRDAASASIMQAQPTCSSQFQNSRESQMAIRLFRCRDCGHSMRLTGSYCSACLLPKALYQRIGTWILVLMIAVFATGVAVIATYEPAPRTAAIMD